MMGSFHGRYHGISSCATCNSLGGPFSDTMEEGVAYCGGDGSPQHGTCEEGFRSQLCTDGGSLLRPLQTPSELAGAGHGDVAYFFTVLSSGLKDLCLRLCPCFVLLDDSLSLLVYFGLPLLGDSQDVVRLRQDGVQEGRGATLQRKYVLCDD
eukprot:gene7681-biopygen14302